MTPNFKTAESLSYKQIYNVGILYPGFSAEQDYPLAERLLGDDVRLLLVHTELKSDAHTPEAMRAAGDPDVLESGAAQLAREGLHSIIWACTSGSFAWGWEGAQKQTENLEHVAGVSASSTSFAFIGALRHLGKTQVAIAATYPETLADLFPAFLRNAGIAVTGIGSGHIGTASEAGEKTPEEVAEFIVGFDHPDAEVLLVPDTALHTIGQIEALEARLGKPVLTANQVSIWQGMRLAGAPLKRANLGTLFR
jgi:maleate cis-trans isomerase